MLPLLWVNWSGHDLDLWHWKPFQQCLLTCWIFVTSFIEIPPVSRDIVACEIDVSGRRMAGQVTGRRNISAAYFWLRNKYLRSYLAAELCTWWICNVLCVGAPSFAQLYTVLRPSGLHVSDVLALCNAMTVALSVSRWTVADDDVGFSRLLLFQPFDCVI